MLRIAGKFRDFHSHGHAPVRDSTRDVHSIGEGQFYCGLAPVKGRDIRCSFWGITGSNFGKESWIVEVAKEELDRFNIKCVIREPPFNLIPCARRAIKETVRSHHEPVWLLL